MRGYFITFEGIEGAGKSTQSVMLHNYLIEKNKKVILTKEPGGTETGKKIRQILLSHSDEIFPPLAELFLYEADRNFHIHNLIKPKIDQGYTVICDRFTDSTLAYQGYARGLDIDFVKEINSIASEGIKPDITFLIDIPVEEGLKRIQKIREKDRIEKEEIDFHKKLREGFLKIAEEERDRIVVLNGLEPPEKIFRQVIEFLKNRNII
ncbi:dTMP kinase [Persephonella sp.]